MLDIAGAATR